jgi:hypothetical protein
VDEVPYLAVLGIVETRPPDRDRTDWQADGGVAQQGDVGRPIPERPETGGDDRSQRGTDGECTRGIGRHRRRDFDRILGEPVRRNRVLRGTQTRDSRGGADADAEDEQDTAVNEDPSSGDGTERRRDGPGQSGRQDAQHRHNQDGERGEHEQDDEQFGEQLEVPLHAVVGAGLLVGEESSLHPEVLGERVRSLVCVFAELQQERR